MKRRPDNPQLTHFLRQHRPSVPPAPADLEDRLMAAVMDTPPAIPAVSPNPYFRLRSRWLWPTAIAAGLVAIVSYQRFLSPQPSEAELAELETFIESTWVETVAEQPATEAEELYVFVDESSVN